MDKKFLLESLKDKFRKEKNLPLVKNVDDFVFGEGDLNAKVMLIGEAPGFWEDKLKRPFVGPAGKLLDKLINEVGLKREEVYISNMVKARPPENRDPTTEEIKSYENFLDYEIEIINPKLIVTLGRFSLLKFLPSEKISQVHGKIFILGGRLILPMYHPAAALRSTAVLESLRDDFLENKEILLGPQNYEIEPEEGQMRLI
ncbi:MAG: hypothetical protein A2Y57_02795 [Candidatus Woykebacteria bacterium RBG_13_40_7b]|uniref:Type-4 uracil-DNA glycosylase n=1 Tax=Candidatus Woykebacteria bacterium RBG_13_40_7b TaxID=1802594 RepID=A0A1G1WBL3_9BACT|nr:MAG: hypothetical protein A2Y57_02795 [Candidatus Woykebacteria bacterium RBG_13_40_7b]